MPAWVDDVVSLAILGAIALLVIVSAVLDEPKHPIRRGIGALAGIVFVAAFIRTLG